MNGAPLEVDTAGCLATCNVSSSVRARPSRQPAHLNTANVIRYLHLSLGEIPVHERVFEHQTLDISCQIGYTQSRHLQDFFIWG